MFLRILHINTFGNFLLAQWELFHLLHKPGRYFPPNKCGIDGPFTRLPGLRQGWVAMFRLFTSAV